jgi:hypothetical protein
MNAMKAKRIITWGGVRYDVGDEVQVDADTAARWERIGIASRSGKAPAKADSLPDDFPERDLILGTQWKTVEALKAATDDDLLAVEGIGPAKLRAIRAALKG